MIHVRYLKIRPNLGQESQQETRKASTSEVTKEITVGGSECRNMDKSYSLRKAIYRSSQRPGISENNSEKEGTRIDARRL